MNELKASEERGKKAMMDAAKLADELRQEQEHSAHVERLRKGLEAQLKVPRTLFLTSQRSNLMPFQEMQARLDEAEGSALKGGKKVIAKLEQRIRDLEIELDGEQRRYAEAQKNFAKQDRRCKELQFQVSASPGRLERASPHMVTLMSGRRRQEISRTSSRSDRESSRKTESLQASSGRVCKTFLQFSFSTSTSLRFAGRSGQREPAKVPSTADPARRRRRTRRGG